MSTAKKFEMAPDEVYIQQALKDGRAVIMEASMKALGTPDVAFQARVKHLDMDHVHRLRMIFDQEGRLAPVVIFRADDPADRRMILADGFHRHEVYRRAGATAIRAYVITVPADRLEHEARLFAAMCNQQLSLGRTPQDVRKAVEILFADPECWVWSDKRIGNHCKLSGGTVQKYRREYQKIHNLDAPKIVKASDGREVPYKRASDGDMTIRKNQSKNGETDHYYTSFLGKSKYLGATKEVAENKIEQLKNEQEKIDLSRKSLVKQNLFDTLLRRGVSLKFFNLDSSYRGIASGLYGRGVIVIPDQMTDRNKTVENIGSLHLLNQIVQTNVNRLIICCYVEDALPNVVLLAKQSGVEFLTPDELVASLKDRETT